MRNPVKRQPLFNHCQIADTVSGILREDLNRVRPTSSKEWEIFKKAQAGLLKKYPPRTKSGQEARSRAAKDKFLQVAGHLCSVDLLLPVHDLLRKSPLGGFSDRDRALVRARSICWQILGDFTDSEFFDECQHGPNSSLGVPFADTGNSRKFVPPWSCTESVVDLFGLYLRYDKLLAETLAISCPNIRRPGGVWTYADIRDSSRLTTVPKNDDIDRTIAIEPTLNMFFQQGLGRLIAKRLVAFGVDIQHQQDKHREMAYTSSITRSHATIDFSSASDCVMTELLKFLLPPVWFYLVDKVRCKTVLVDDMAIPLNCIATMGNATTFVLETLVLFSLGVACTMPDNRSVFPEWEHFQTVSVFGDDCIIPSKNAHFFIEVCKSVGFIVNDSKSFVDETEPFRESCGADYVSGYNVRPVYLHGPRSNKPSVLRAWLYTLWNVLCKRLISGLGGRNYAYTQTLQYLACQISKHNSTLFVVPLNDPDDAGVKLYGDAERLLRLFSIPVARLSRDRNNTLIYSKLVSAKPQSGFVSEELEMWLRLKFPPSFNVLRPQVETSSYTVRKSDRGYVVSNGRAFCSTMEELAQASQVGMCRSLLGALTSPSETGFFTESG